jgi:membrane-associated phospholipid phosphatase
MRAKRHTFILLKGEKGMRSFERLFFFMARPKTILISFLLVILAYYYMDRELALWIYHHHLQEKLFFLKGLTLLGENILILGILISVALTFRLIKPQKLWEERAWFLCLCVFIPNLICLILKVFLGRARPELFLQEGIYGFFGLHSQSMYWSLPSGHTTTVMSLAFGLSVLFPKRTFTFIIIALCVVATRILLLKHFVSDVMTASFLSIIEVGIIELVVLKRYQYFKLARRVTVGAHE